MKYLIKSKNRNNTLTELNKSYGKTKRELFHKLQTLSWDTPFLGTGPFQCLGQNCIETSVKSCTSTKAFQ